MATCFLRISTHGSGGRNAPPRYIRRVCVGIAIESPGRGVIAVAMVIVGRGLDSRVAGLSSWVPDIVNEDISDI